MAAVGTSISSTNSISFSSKNDTNTCNTTTTSTTTITNTATNVNNNSTPSPSPQNHSKSSHTANTTTLLTDSGCQNKVESFGNNLQKEHQISGENTRTLQQQPDHEFFRKILQHNDDMEHYNQPQHVPSSPSLINMAADDLRAASGNPVTSILSASGSTSLIEHLMPSDHQQSPPPWSTYSMPIFPSFGMDMNYDGENTMTSDQAPIMPSKINNDSSRILSLGSNLIGRFNQSSNSDIKYPSASGGSAMRISSRQDNPILGSGRSYSNVLHSQHDLPNHDRLSMFQQQQQQQSQMSSDLNSITATPLSTHSSLIPTNHHHRSQQTGPPSSLTSSTASSNQFQQQARRANEFITTSRQQQAYHQTYQQQQQTNTTPPFNSGTNQAQQSNGGPSLSPLGGNYFLRGAPANFNVEKQSSDINDASSKFTSSINGPNKRRNKLPFFTGTNVGAGGGSDPQNQVKVDSYGSVLVNSDGSERFSRKVFVGGLPPDIDEEEIKASFRRFGSLIVDWPHKAESKSYFPPKGYAFLLFHEESSVQALIDACLLEDDKLYLCVSSPTIKDKPVQIRPWRLSDADFVLDSTLALDPRKTVFVGGVPRPLKASELANIMNNLYGGVCYAGIDTDPELKYPKGAGRVAFSNHQSYIAAISARFVHLHHSEIEKRVEVKPYVLDDQFCDECQGTRCGSKFAPFFCANITCLQYYCDNCWSTVHSQPGREFHKPLVKEGADRPRGVPFRWC